MDNEFSGLDLEDINKAYNLRMLFHSSSNPDVKYSGYIDTILENGVSLKASESCAEGHRISFSIFHNDVKLLDGTGIIESIDRESDKILNIVCVFSQFSEQDKEILRKKAESNQQEINSFLDDIS